jgi:hypothetical protein
MNRPAGAKGCLDIYQSMPFSAELEKLPRIYACFFSPMGTFVEKSVWNRTGKYGHNTGYQWI